MFIILSTVNGNAGTLVVLGGSAALPGGAVLVTTVKELIKRSYKGD